ncbi:MAG: DUF2723 domain-containing protein [Gemmatimonadaceae bacterium]
MTSSRRVPRLPDSTSATPTTTAVRSAVFLLVVYLLTLAPSVTLWDSGEFLSAIKTLGVPHPPGTPLFVFVAHAWADVFGWLPFALAVNAASAVATAAAAACLAWLMTRWTGRPEAGLAGALVGGTMATVWQSATETEVYAYALLAMALGLVAAELAAIRGSARHRLLVAAIFGLAVPLHISVLIAGPAIVLLAATDTAGRSSWRAAMAPAGAWCVATAIGTVSPYPLVAGVLLLVVASIYPVVGERAAVGRGEAWRAAAITVLCASFVLVLVVRARHDPGVNQGNPATWEAMWEVVARRQYDVPPLWPRRAPAWLQVGNLVQYADWQVASALSNAPGPSPWRTPVTVVFVALGIAGCLWHRARDVRSWRVILLLFVCATLGVITVLNLRTGPSYGWGVLPDDALRESRERDYFFALAFVLWGLWAGCGIVALRDRMRRGPGGLVFALAAVPLLLNWRAVDRSRAPEARLAQRVAEALLHDAPQGSVLILAGDNDTYPIWFVQEVLGQRRDVVTVTVPMLGAGWYREELARRHQLLDSTTLVVWRGLAPTMRAIGDRARRTGRVLTATVSLDAAQRRMLDDHGRWQLKGMVLQRADGNAGPTLSIDSVAVEASARRLDGVRAEVLATPARDPAGEYIQRVMSCPFVARDRVRGRVEGPGSSLESICNFR